MKFGTQTQEAHAEFKNRYSELMPLFSKMATTAISKIDCQLYKELLKHDFDETWYTDVKTPAEVKCKSGYSLLFSKMAPTTMLKICYQLLKAQLKPDFDEIRYTDVNVPAEFK
jgi:hypothetical protein